MRIECRATSHVCRLSLGKAGVAATRLRGGTAFSARRGGSRSALAHQALVSCDCRAPYPTPPPHGPGS